MPGNMSASKMSLLDACEVAYVNRYVRKVKASVGPSPQLVVGRAVHAAAEHDLRAVAEVMRLGGARAGADLSLAEVRAAAEAEFDAAAAGRNPWRRSDGTVIVFEGLPVEWDLHEQPEGRVRDAALLTLVPTWLAEVAPTVYPRAVEHRIDQTIDMGDGEPMVLTTRLDVLPANGDLADLKTGWSGRHKSEADAAKDLQLSVLQLAYESEVHAPPAALGWDALHLSKSRAKGREGELSLAKEAVTRTRVPPRDAHQLAVTRERVILAERRARDLDADRVEAVPADPGAWKCSELYCEFWRTCPFGRGAPGT